jgi:hypothetical protein
MKSMLPLTLVAGLALAACGAGHAGEPRTTAESGHRYVVTVDGMT